MFDPEKVGDIGPYVMNEYNQTLRAVTRRDYDQLLELYKAEIKSKPLIRIVPFLDGYWVFAEEFSFFAKPPREEGINDESNDRPVGGLSSV